jgi:hypothetical protein
MASLRYKTLNFSLLLIIGIIILCISFLVISCGRGPKRKAPVSETGQFSIDFSLSPENNAAIFGQNKSISSIKGTEITVEAWVKRRTNPSDLNGGIFGRLDAVGTTLYVKSNTPKFAIKRLLPDVPTSTPGVTSTEEFIVGATSTLINNVWTHIAGLLVNDSHSHPTSTSCTFDVMTEKPHLDIYIDGEFSNCATTKKQFAEEPGSKQVSIGVIGGQPIDGIDGSARFNGVLDEVRFWRIARTQNQIQNCIGQELSFYEPGDCRIDLSILEGYWRLNEGEGHTAKDFSGNGINGGVEFFFVDPEPGFPASPWDEGWVDGAPIIRKEETQ